MLDDIPIICSVEFNFKLFIAFYFIECYLMLKFNICLSLSSFYFLKHKIAHSFYVFDKKNAVETRLMRQ